MAGFKKAAPGYAQCVSGGASLSGAEHHDSPSAAWGSLPLLEVAGELDLSVAPWLHDQIEALFVGGGNSIVVDLSRATFLDSTALGVFVSALTRARTQGGDVHLIVDEPQILRVLTITGFKDKFVVHESRNASPDGRREP